MAAVQEEARHPTWSSVRLEGEESRGGQDREGPTQASEVSGDGLQGVCSRTMDVHILEGGTQLSDVCCTFTSIRKGVTKQEKVCS